MAKDQKVVVAQSGAGPAFLLFLTFLVLKLTGVIGWSWWWITAPLWIPFALVAGIWGFVLLLCGLAAAVAGVVVGASALIRKGKSRGIKKPFS